MIEEDFVKKIRRSNADAAVLCFCSAEEKDVDLLSRLNSLAGPIPVLACNKTYNPNFVSLAAQQGVRHFLLCDMENNRIWNLISTAIREETLQSFLESCWPGCLTASPYAGKMINELVNAFPSRLSTVELSRQLGIGDRTVQMICQQTFGMTCTRLMRWISIYHALTMMKNTDLDNTEIAIQLQYSDQSSLARIFRKELGYSPGEARRRLAMQSPETLLTSRLPN
jgi:AraC-like DNA-binding protein